MASSTELELWKLKKLIQRLETTRGSGTSMISLIIPPGTQISKPTKMLTEEYGAASNIKSRVNRQSVQGAIRSAQARLKTIPRVPANGIALFIGEALTGDGKMRKVTEAIEPPKPITSDLISDDTTFGFIIVDGKGALFTTLSGTAKTVLARFNVDLPKKHARGGQSALRFSRLRDEARHNYIRKVATMAATSFLKDNAVTVDGLILAGSADLKTDLQGSDLFDKRLSQKVLQVVDVEYGGDVGFNEAIEASAHVLGGVKMIEEQKVLKKYFDGIAKDTGKISYGINDTVRALEQGAVEKFIIAEDLDLELHGTSILDKGGKSIMKSPYLFASNKEDNIQLVDWFMENHQNFGIELLLVSDSSSEGNQFVRGMGGVGAFLRWEVNFELLNDLEEFEDWD